MDRNKLNGLKARKDWLHLKGRTLPDHLGKFIYVNEIILTIDEWTGDSGAMNDIVRLSFNTKDEYVNVRRKLAESLYNELKNSIAKLDQLAKIVGDY